MKKIGIVGAGLIGSSWSAIFASIGFEVYVYDKDTDVFKNFEERVNLYLEELKYIDEEVNIPKSFDLISSNMELETLCKKCDFIQECSPEIVDLKQELFAYLDKITPENVILSSSSSAMPISLITQNLKGKKRCIISHPAKPPHLIPCVEISPGNQTSETTIKKTQKVFEKIGYSIIHVKKEIDGFILNRLQGALLNEAMRLYSEGYASADHIDSTVRDGLGLRWAFMGPFDTIDFNAPGGIKDYIRRYGNIFTEMARNQNAIPDWSEANAKKIEEERRVFLSEKNLKSRAEKRNDLLKSLRKLKKDMNEDVRK